MSEDTPSSEPEGSTGELPGEPSPGPRRPRHKDTRPQPGPRRPHKDIKNQPRPTPHIQGPPAPAKRGISTRVGVRRRPRLPTAPPARPGLLTGPPAHTPVRSRPIPMVGNSPASSRDSTPASPMAPRVPRPGRTARRVPRPAPTARTDLPLLPTAGRRSTRLPTAHRASPAPTARTSKDGALPVGPAGALTLKAAGAPRRRSNRSLAPTARCEPRSEWWRRSSWLSADSRSAMR